MAKIVNPFIVTGRIEPKYFCDRVTESAPDGQDRADSVLLRQSTKSFP